MKRPLSRCSREWGLVFATAGLGLACVAAEPRQADHGTGELLLRADIDPPERTVTVTWRYADDGDFGRPPDACIDEAFPVAFVPTYVEVRPPGTVYVAGWSDGSTMVEEWTLRPPELPEPGSLVLEPRGRARVDTILHVPSASAGPVRTMFWNRGRERSLFVRFVQAPDVIELRWRPGEFGSARVVLSAAEQPALSISGYDESLCGDHSTAGYVYGLHARARLDLQPSLILMDTDRDGDLDASEVCGFAELEALGLKDPGLWIELDNEPVRR